MAFIPIYILILAFTIIIDYIAGILLENSKGRKRKKYLIASLAANIGVLAVFKYYNFINENITAILYSTDVKNPFPFLNILLPIGLSFHTFQAMSYTIEVYRGNQKAERHFGIYALYVMFYPQLVAGPIERPQNLLHQFYEKHYIDFQRITQGLKLILWGFFKKLVIADRLAIYVNPVYNNPTYHSGTTLLLATFFFGFQIYCDFSGYSDIAIGTAKIMGFKLMNNFNRPYLSRSISEFWKRWHISLSSWFRDYLYFSLGGNRVIKYRWYFNLFLVFLISGLWHGANWTYIIWGTLNGFYLIFAIVTLKFRNQLNEFTGLNKKPTLNSAIDIIITFLFVNLAWIFFRANNLSDALLIIKKIFLLEGPLFYEKGDPSSLIFSFLVVFLLIMAEAKNEFFEKWMIFTTSGRWYVRLLSYAFVIILIELIGVFDGSQFIYFQF